eukprot:jgi/Ulvmu1/10706/UM067_0032.1
MQPDTQPIQQPDQPAAGDPCVKQVPRRAVAAELGPSAAVVRTDAHESVPNGDDVAAAHPHSSAKQPKLKAAVATCTPPTCAARKRPAPASGTLASAASKRSKRARQHPTASQTMQNEGAGMSAVETAIALLQVADVLDDASTQAEAWAVLTAELQAECSMVSEASRKLPTNIATQVLARLSDDTAFSVLQAMHVPLATLLIYLAATPFCPLVIRAFHPTINSHATLALPPWPPLIGVAAHTAIATFTHLETLFITGLGSPIPLIAIPQLPRLDFRPLAAALPTLPALHTLRLAGTLSACASIRELADALPQMSALTHLSVGGPAPLSTESAAWGAQRDPALLSVDELPGLFKKGSAREEQTKEGNNLKDVEEADVGEVQHTIRGLLSLAAALLRGQICLRALGAGFGMLTGLTYLNCRLFSTGLGVLDRDRTVEFAKKLQPLKGLRSLRFPDAMLPMGGCKHVWQSLSRLKRLTHVDSVEGPWFPYANSAYTLEVPTAEPSDINGAAAAAVAAAAGEAVKLNMRAAQREAARLRADKVGPALPLCGTVELDCEQLVRVAAAVDALAPLHAVTALTLSLPGAGPPHEDVH